MRNRRRFFLDRNQKRGVRAEVWLSARAAFVQVRECRGRRRDWTKAAGLGGAADAPHSPPEARTRPFRPVQPKGPLDAVPASLRRLRPCRTGRPSASPMRARRLPEPVHAVAVIRLVSGRADSADGVDQLPGLASGAAARNRPFPEALAGSGKGWICRKFRMGRLRKKYFHIFCGPVRSRQTAHRLACG